MNTRVYLQVFISNHDNCIMRLTYYICSCQLCIPIYSFHVYVQCKHRMLCLSQIQLKHLKFFFNFNEMRQLLDSYLYSVLYYNCEIWLTPELNSNLKQSLLSMSALALRSCLNGNSELSFKKLHKECKNVPLLKSCYSNCPSTFTKS